MATPKTPAGSGSVVALGERDGSVHAELAEEGAVVAGDDEATGPEREGAREGALADEVEAEGGLVQDEQLDGGGAGEERDERRASAFARAERGEGALREGQRELMGDQETGGFVAGEAKTK
jgi:hypothetical protein